MVFPFPTKASSAFPLASFFTGGNRLSPFSVATKWVVPVLEPLFDWAYKDGGMLVTTVPVISDSNIRLATTNGLGTLMVEYTRKYICTL